ncbi:MAG: hypothetical protein ACI4O7_01580 [Aristaeellaceae bacterium]
MNNPTSLFVAFILLPLFMKKAVWLSPKIDQYPVIITIRTTFGGKSVLFVAWFIKFQSGAAGAGMVQ